jgi:hypothetical protein
MGAEFRPSGKRATRGAKSASKQGFPRGRLRELAMLRNRLLGCPKTLAGLSLRAFESSISLLPTGCVFTFDVG